MQGHPIDQQINVTQIKKNEGCLGGCGTLLAVAVVLGLAIEYWYVSIGVAVLAIGFAVYWFGFRAREAVEAAEPSPAIGGGGGASRVTSTGPARPSSQDAVCENCGATGLSGLFCPNCGAGQALTVLGLWPARALQSVLSRVRLCHLQASRRVRPTDAVRHLDLHVRGGSAQPRRAGSEGGLSYSSPLLRGLRHGY